VTTPRLIRAAGCIVWRYGNREPEVLLVHRPRLQDWSFPKGKLDRGETPMAAAVREVEEETGLHVRLGPRLPDSRYTVNGRTPKVVYYWSAQPPKNADITTYAPNQEVDDVRWLKLSKARKRLTYPHDKELLDAFAASPYDSSPLLVLRHSEARSRKAWAQDDTDRPLKVEGARQAAALVPSLAAYGVTRVVTSDAARCVDTVLPYVNARRVKLILQPGISEDGATPKQVRRVVQKALRSKRPTVLCSHRPVLADIFRALGQVPIPLEPGGIVVVHRNRGKVLGLETI
jgi:8-oxo-dGTP pyrophosphatase MutT (NUDIX family)/phosphohistidine phosphatase SixA